MKAEWAEIVELRVVQKYRLCEETSQPIPCAYEMQFRRAYDSAWMSIPVVHEFPAGFQPQVELATILSTVS